MDNETEEMVLQFPRVIPWWHWFHGYSPWGDVFSQTTGGLSAFVNGVTRGPWWQSRSCVTCNHTQRRRVEVHAGQG